jgi:hypothetical protein
MTEVELKNQLLLLADAHKAEEVDLQDAEIIERSALKLITEFIVSNDLLQGVNLGIEIPSDFTQLSTDKLSYMVDSISLTNDIVLDLNWTVKSAFWNDEFESKEDYLEMLKEMIQNKGSFYDLEDEF